MLFTACAGRKSSHGLIHHTSKYQQLMNQYNSGGSSPGVIDLSDGKKLNYDGSLGPGDPNFGGRSLSSP